MKAPLAFLWAELETLLSDATLAELRRRYEAHKHAYDRAAKIRAVQRRIVNLERWTVTPRRNRMLDRAHTRLKTLQDEQNVT